MAYSRRGLGAYPSDAYYDPGRPVWLPYWIDDFTESQNKAAYALSTGALGPAGIAASPLVATAPGQSPYLLPPAPATIQPPDMRTDPTGQTVDPDAQIAAMQAQNIANFQQWANQQSASMPCLSQASSLTDYFNCLTGNPLDSPPGSPTKIPSWVIIGGIVAALLFFGGRR